MAQLLQDVTDARTALASDRRRPGSSASSNDAVRDQLLQALTAYAAALEDRRLPVPYALRDELRIGQAVASRHLAHHRW